MGGPRALAALGLKPSVYHMNEGHAAFLGLERIRHFVRAHKLDFRSALQIVAGGGIFTTHTPVPAGNDAFSPELIAHYFSDYPAQVGVDFDYFFSLGQTTVNKTNDFSMTILALRTSRQANGVSKLHGEVSKGLWKDVWAGVPEAEVPITSITNGIHTKTWAAPEFMELYTQYLGTDWEENLTNVDYWLRVNRIPDDVLWDTHQKLKARLIDFARTRVRAQRERLGESPAQLRQVNNILNPEILTIGFARRFATYKRGALLFGQSERLLKLINDPSVPCSSFSRARPTRRTTAARRSSRRFTSTPAVCSTPIASCSSRITTPTSAGGSTRASISGSTIRSGRSKPAARAA